METMTYTKNNDKLFVELLGELFPSTYDLYHVVEMIHSKKCIIHIIDISGSE